jgi:diacylglycerol kinase (ATP)
LIFISALNYNSINNLLALHHEIETEKMMRYEKEAGLSRLSSALHNSIVGLYMAIKNEVAFRQNLIFCLIMIALATLVSVKPSDFLIMFGSIILVLIVELINSAIETTVDRISLDKNELSKLAKDYASAAVFIALVNCVGVHAFFCWNYAMHLSLG